MRKIQIITSIFPLKNYATHKDIKLTNNLEQNNIPIISDFLSALPTLKNPSTKNEISRNIETLLMQKKKKT